MPLLDLKKINLKKLLQQKSARVDQRNKSHSKSLKIKWIKFVLVFLIAVASVSGIIILSSQITKLKRQQIFLIRLLRTTQVEPGDPDYLGDISTPKLPSRLSDTPFGEESGLVVGVKTVNIRGVSCPYNASLHPAKSGYDLFFRYRVGIFRHNPPYFQFRIGVVHLNNEFEQGENEFKRIVLPTGGEDPRVIQIGNHLYLFYNASHKHYATMHLADLDKNSFQVNYASALDLDLSRHEKNWSPFEYVDENGKSRLLMEYQIGPRKILEVLDPYLGILRFLGLPQKKPDQIRLWEKKWGEVRGGTPAIRIGDSYLGFFHSRFRLLDRTYWYVMGAYTFEATPPFRLTGFSPYPIFFDGIYNCPYIRPAGDTEVIFPCGFVIEKQGDRELIHLSCGENDSGIKIITLDKEKLLKSLVLISVIPD